jgi:hypothetical protein
MKSNTKPQVDHNQNAMQKYAYSEQQYQKSENGAVLL